MHTRCTGWVALAVVLAGAPRVEAGCPIALEGEAPVLEQLRSELTSFEHDGTACVAVWVACHQDGDHIALELRDDLRRSAQRRFTSAAGAAAFIVSWTQRPLLARPAGGSVLAPMAGASAPRVTRSSGSLNRWPSQPWHVELAGAYVITTGDEEEYGVLTASILRRIAWFRFGASARLISDRDGLENAEGELTVGASEQVFEQFALRIELTGSRALWQASNAVNQHWGQAGLRGSARLMLTWEATPSLGLEIGGALDTVSAIEDAYGDTHQWGYGEFYSFAHIDIGMRWAL